MKSALIIPTFNEGDRVSRIIEAGLESERFGEIVVVDDGSTDRTPSVLNSYPDITVLTHSINFGKGQALDTGMMHVRRNGHDAAVFLDADLLGVRPHHVDDLLKPIEAGDSCMSIGYLGLRNTVIKKAVLNQWGALSGQRALRTDVWDLLSSRDKYGWNIEAALNARLRKNNLHRSITRVALEGVSHVGKHEKVGTWPKAFRAYADTYAAALRTYARIEFE